MPKAWTPWQSTPLLEDVYVRFLESGFASDLADDILRPDGLNKLIAYVDASAGLNDKFEQKPIGSAVYYHDSLYLRQFSDKVIASRVDSKLLEGSPTEALLDLGRTSEIYVVTVVYQADPIA